MILFVGVSDMSALTCRDGAISCVVIQPVDVLFAFCTEIQGTYGEKNANLNLT